MFQVTGPFQGLVACWQGGNMHCSVLNLVDNMDACNYGKDRIKNRERKHAPMIDCLGSSECDGLWFPQNNMK